MFHFDYIINILLKPVTFGINLLSQITFIQSPGLHKNRNVKMIKNIKVNKVNTNVDELVYKLPQVKKIDPELKKIKVLTITRSILPIHASNRIKTFLTTSKTPKENPILTSITIEQIK